MLCAACSVSHLPPLDISVSQVPLQTSAVQCWDLHLAETHWRQCWDTSAVCLSLLSHCSHLEPCSGTNCTGLGALCFPFSLSWIIPACIPFYLTDPPLTQEVCVPISPLNPWLRGICSLYSALHPGSIIVFPCARHLPCLPDPSLSLLAGTIIPPSFLSPMLGETGDARSYFLPIWEIHYLTAGSTGRAVREGCARRD